MAGVAGDAVGVGGVGVLNGDLHVVEAGRRQRLQSLARQRHGRCDEVGVEADLGRLRHDRFEVAPHGGLAAREVQLQDAEIGCLREHVEPNLRRQLAGNALELERVGAVGTLQRTAVGQLRQQPDGRPRTGLGATGRTRFQLHAHAVTTPLSASCCSSGTISARIRSLGAL